MKTPIVQSPGGITLVGGAPVSLRLFREATGRAPCVVAADSGADRCLRLGVQPEAVIGDMDSVGARARGVLPPGIFHPIAEQDTTDFDKALRSIDAPFVLAVGFLGARIDHALAVLNVLARRPETCIALGGPDLIFRAPPELDLELRRGDRFSLFPLAPVRGTSRGLVWPIDGIGLSPGGRIGTSNRVAEGPVGLSFEGPGPLVILPRGRLDAVLSALGAAPPAVRGG